MYDVVPRAGGYSRSCGNTTQIRGEPAIWNAGSIRRSFQVDRTKQPRPRGPNTFSIALILLTVWPGQAGANRFGNPPSTALLPTKATAGRAVLWTPALLLIVIEGGILSFALLNERLRHAYEKQYELSRRPQPVAPDIIFASPPPRNGE